MLPTLVHSVVVSEFNYTTFFLEKYAVAQLIEALSFKRKIADSIPDSVIGTFH